LEVVIGEPSFDWHCWEIPKPLTFTLTIPNREKGKNFAFFSLLGDRVRYDGNLYLYATTPFD
jgi:hypothetical protein